jgi:excisionase family DNA binding protein
MAGIEPNGVYTTQETQELLKVSHSTIKRLLKRGIIKANKLGGQYRILGREILRSISPEVEKKAIHEYKRFKRKTKEIIKDW